MPSSATRSSSLSAGRFTADLRMWRHSGIGRYLRNLVPLLLPQLHCERVRLIGRRELFESAAWLDDSRIEFVEETAPIYSIPEQTMALRGRFAGSTLLWVPHFNAPLWYSGKMAVTIHDVAPLALPEILGNSLKRFYARQLIERSVSHSGAILCVSEFTRSELRDRLDVPAAKLHVTSIGLDVSWPTQAQPHCEPDGTPYILFVGNVKPNKNIGLLLRAFRDVMDRVPFRLVLAGRMSGLGTADEAVLREAQSFGDRVRFAGEVSDAELQDLYAGASALCMPSKYEGFGLPLLEAMALGCPVLCSTSGSLPEVAGDAALYFSADSVPELAACLLRVDDGPAMTALRELGRQRVQAFSFPRCASQTAAVMNALLEEPS
jgi:glycosyltransferase involved in cell wall biosynthesis